MGTVKAICVSGERGVQKHPVEKASFAPEWGIVGDAHGGNWHRQVSLLGDEKIQAFREKGAQVDYGAFGENLVVEGFDFRSLPVGTLLRCGPVLLEITQIGKECHSHCEIYKAMGDCIMPREGVFARVLEGGEIQVGDTMQLAERTGVRPFQAAVITLSDKGAMGQRRDESGPAIVKRLEEQGYQVVEALLLADEQAVLQKQLIRLCDQRQLDLILTTGGTGFAPRDVTPEATMAVALLADEQAVLQKQLIRLCDQRQLDLILTTGGTGFAPRDVTPEATMAVAHRNVPGIAEAIRAASMRITPRAMLSRGVSVIRGKTLIVNLPGSPKAVQESMDVFLDVIPHALTLLRGEGGECARK